MRRVVRFPSPTSCERRMRWSSQDVCVNIGPPRMSPAAQIPGTLVASLSSTARTPCAPGFKPTVSSPRSSVLARRPAETKRWDAAKTSRAPPFSTIAARPLRRGDTRVTWQFKRNWIPSDSRRCWSLSAMSRSSFLDLVPAVDDRHPAPHPPVELPHLEGDVAASREENVARQLVLVEPVARVQERDAREATDRAEVAPRAGVEHDLARAQTFLPDSNLEEPPLAPLEPGTATHEPRVVGFLEAAPDACPRVHQDAARAIEDRREVDLDLRDPQAEDRCAPREIGGARRRDHRLRRRAAEIDARAPEVLPFRDRDALARLRERVRERNARLARADDDDVERRSGYRIWHAVAGYPTREIPRHMKTNHGAVGPPEASSSSEPPAIATDGKRRVVFLNPAAERLLGVRQKDVLGSELSSVLSREAMDTLARSAILRIPGAVPHAERAVYILDPATSSCPLSKQIG